MIFRKRRAIIFKTNFNVRVSEHEVCFCIVSVRIFAVFRLILRVVLGFENDQTQYSNIDPKGTLEGERQAEGTRPFGGRILVWGSTGGTTTGEAYHHTTKLQNHKLQSHTPINHQISIKAPTINTRVIG